VSANLVSKRHVFLENRVHALDKGYDTSV
jgi:hypothetical protein